jgi:predicted MFS family arabinose efflux permease
LRAPAPAAGRVVAVVFVPFACGYFLSYLYRAINAVIAPNLVADIGLSAADLGLLTSAYFLTFALAQLPLGLFLDRVGPRRVQSVLLLAGATGALLFAAGESRDALTLARGLIGIGAAGGLMAGLKAISLWFPRERLALVNACYLAVGGLGAISATAPVEALLHLTDWRGLFTALAGGGVAASALIFLAVPEKAAEAAPGNLAGQLRGLAQIYRDRLFWRIVPLSAAAAGTSMAVQSLWAGPWLRDVAGLSRAQVATHLLVMATALTAGLLSAGLLADLGRRFGLGLPMVIGFSVIAFLAVQVAVLLELTGFAYGLWAAYGFFGNMSSLTFAALAQHFPTALTGRANSAFNVIAILTAFAVQYVIGAIIDLWPATAAGGYAPEGYRAALGLMFGVQVLALGWFLWPRHWARAAP